MGNSADWLNVQNSSFKIKDVTAAHQRERWKLPPRYLGIGVSRLEAATDVFLDLADSPENPAVVSIPLTVEAEIPGVLRSGLVYLGESLEEVFGMEAFKVLELGVTRYRLELTQKRLVPDSLVKVEEIAGQFEMGKLWFSTQSGLAFTGDDIVMKARQPAKSMLSLALGSDEQAKLNQFSQTLIEKLDLILDFNATNSLIPRSASP
jgi:hypothetical protein